MKISIFSLGLVVLALHVSMVLCIMPERIELFPRNLQDCDADCQLNHVKQVCGSLRDSCDQRPRHIMFIVDASNSIDPDRFYGEMLDYVQRSYCMFEEEGSKAGMIIFNKKITKDIPFGTYSRYEWIQAVEQLRDPKNGRCCKCCTPTAEALDKAKVVFEENPLSEDTDVQRIALIVTDGKPYPNWGDGPYERRNMAESVYFMEQVPASAQMLKDLDVRLMLVVVPSKDSTVIHDDYFKGSNHSERMCTPFRKKEVCREVNHPPFPIISTPVESNVFAVSDWNMDNLFSITREKICNSAWVPTCKGPPRDIIFALDASKSMEKTRFFGEMIDVVLNLYLSLDHRKRNRVSVLTFSNGARLLIPLEERGPQEFVALMEEIRQDETKCCVCCTPTAEAAFKAAEHLNQTEDIGNDQIVFFVTDGVPQQLKGTGEYKKNTMPLSQYLAEVVPEGAQAIKDLGATLILIGVPNRFNEPPNEDYFRGLIGEQVCSTFNNKRRCFTYENGYGKFPLVSEPADDHIFTAKSWNLKELTQDMYNLMCTLKSPLVSAPTGNPSSSGFEYESEYENEYENEYESVSVPTGSPSTSSPSQNPTEFVPIVSFVADGGPQNSQSECVIPFTYNGVEYHDCISMEGDTQPFIPGNQNLMYEPANIMTNITSWCPTYGKYSSTSTKLVDGVAIRKHWGYCLKTVSTRSPSTSSPTTLNPTTSSPTTSFPTSEPTTSSPTTGFPTPEPTTSSPTTRFSNEPTTSSPTTRFSNEPTTSSPTTEPPSATTNDPVTDSPTKFFTPTTSSPTSSSNSRLNFANSIQFLAFVIFLKFQF